MLKIDRSSVDVAIKNLDGMFTATQEVLNEYEIEKNALEEREEFLKDRLTKLQEEHTQTMLEREIAKDNPSDYVYMTKQLTSIDEEVKVLLSLQDQLKGEFKALKQQYLPKIRETYSKDSSARNKHFNVNESVHNIRDELKKAISDYEQAIDNQDSKVMPIIYNDFLADSELMSESWDDPSRRRKALAFKRTFDHERTRLFYDSQIKL